MHIYHVLRLAAALLIVTLAMIVSTGCRPSCPGTAEVPASWGQIGFKVVDGGTVCAYSDKQISVDQGGYEIPDLYEKYKQQLTAAGWKVSELQRSALTFDATKDKEAFTVYLRECYKYAASPSTWSKCTNASIKRNDPMP